MPKWKDKILKFINKILNKKSIQTLPEPQNEQILNEVVTSGLVRQFEDEINNNLGLKGLEDSYFQRLSSEKDIYNLPLSSKLSEAETIELAKNFFASLGIEISNKASQVIDNKSDKFKFIFEQYGKTVRNNGMPREAEVSIGNNQYEVYCPIRGDLRDLYGIVHEVTHTFDLANGDNETRQVFGEVAPQCMERLLDEYLLNLSENDLQHYGINRNVLIQDIRNRQVSTFLSRRDIIKSFNGERGNRQIDLRYIFAILYSSEFLKFNSNTRQIKLDEFIKNVENNNMSLCKNAFEIDLQNKLKMQFAMQNIVSNVKNVGYQIMLYEAMQDMLIKAKDGKNFKVEIGNQNVHINLESKIPFILITPSNLQNGQTLVMESNNLETNMQDKLLVQALETGKNLNDILKGQSPILIPILPSDSPNAPYYQQLSAECFKSGNRPDLDIVEVIDRAKKIMKEEYGTKVNDRVFLNGYSSSGCFAQRFALIHPELIGTACIGGASRKYSNPR